MKPRFHIDTTGSLVTVKVSGGLGVKFHRELYSGFSGIPSQTNVKLVIEPQNGLDLYFAQLVYAFSKKVKDEGYECSVITTITPSEADLLTKSGLGHLFNISTTSSRSL